MNSPTFRKGDQVVFRGQSDAQRRWGGNDDASSLLTVNEVYVIRKVELHSWHTKLEFENVTGRFNSVCFRPVTPSL
jgi:hypothetical protein